MSRDFGGEKQTMKTATQSGFWSNTMGVHPNQVAGEMKRHPDWKFNKAGQLWINNLKDQRQKVKALGMINYDDN